MSLNPIPKELFFSRSDLKDPRLGDWSEQGKLTDDADLFILGYPDDEGIRLNGGRPGAGLAPDRIRKYFYKMTPHLQFQALAQIRDLGNLSTSFELKERHQQARQQIELLSAAQKKFISLGGGHDYGFPDSAGFIAGAKKWSNKKPLIINFDAHLDVRPTDKGFHSGTPFYRLLCEYADQCDFIEIGIQPQCNSRFHKNWAQEKGAVIVGLETVENQGLQALLGELTEADPTRPCFLSIDIDSFSNAEAPGCSQSWASGLKSNEFLNTLDFLVQRFHVGGCGIYEVSPELDTDDRTSKLAALIMHKFLFSSLFFSSEG